MRYVILYVKNAMFDNGYFSSFGRKTMLKIWKTYKNLLNFYLWSWPTKQINVFLDKMYALQIQKNPIGTNLEMTIVKL